MNKSLRVCFQPRQSFKKTIGDSVAAVAQHKRVKKYTKNKKIIGLLLSSCKLFKRMHNILELL
jgi:hypothetical protein